MYVEILILAHLTRQPAHGYEIKRSVEQTLGETYPVNNNQLYPALRRFEEMGAITREVVRQMGKPDRHLYRMTDRGEEVLQGLLRDFPPALARDDVEFQVRVAFFHLLDPDARRAILEARAAVLRAWGEHLRRSQEAVRAHPEITWALQVLSFTTQRIEQELAWIADLMRQAV
jgi:DNA-binding PadR family transcriptional regulator